MTHQARVLTVTWVSIVLAIISQTVTADSDWIPMTGPFPAKDASRQGPSGVRRRPPQARESIYQRGVGRLLLATPKKGLLHRQPFLAKPQNAAFSAMPAYGTITFNPGDVIHGFNNAQVFKEPHWNQQINLNQHPTQHLHPQNIQNDRFANQHRYASYQNHQQFQQVFHPMNVPKQIQQPSQPPQPANNQIFKNQQAEQEFRQEYREPNRMIPPQQISNDNQQHHHSNQYNDKERDHQRPQVGQNQPSGGNGPQRHTTSNHNIAITIQVPPQRNLKLLVTQQSGGYQDAGRLTLTKQYLAQAQQPRPQIQSQQGVPNLPQGTSDQQQNQKPSSNQQYSSPNNDQVNREPNRPSVQLQNQPMINQNLARSQPPSGHQHPLPGTQGPPYSNIKLYSPPQSPSGPPTNPGPQRVVLQPLPLAPERQHPIQQLSKPNLSPGNIPESYQSPPRNLINLEPPSNIPRPEQHMEFKPPRPIPQLQVISAGNQQYSNNPNPTAVTPQPPALTQLPYSVVPIQSTPRPIHSQPPIQFQLQLLQRSQQNLGHQRPLEPLQSLQPQRPREPQRPLQPQQNHGSQQPLQPIEQQRHVQPQQNIVSQRPFQPQQQLQPQRQIELQHPLQSQQNLGPQRPIQQRPIEPQQTLGHLPFQYQRPIEPQQPKEPQRTLQPQQNLAPQRPIQQQRPIEPQQTQQPNEPQRHLQPQQNIGPQQQLQPQRPIEPQRPLQPQQNLGPQRPIQQQRPIEPQQTLGQQQPFQYQRPIEPQQTQHPNEPQRHLQPQQNTGPQEQLQHQRPIEQQRPFQPQQNLGPQRPTQPQRPIEPHQALGHQLPLQHQQPSQHQRPQEPQRPIQPQRPSEPQQLLKPQDPIQTQQLPQLHHGPFDKTRLMESQGPQQPHNPLSTPPRQLHPQPQQSIETQRMPQHHPSGGPPANQNFPPQAQFTQAPRPHQPNTFQQPFPNNGNRPSPPINKPANPNPGNFPPELPKFQGRQEQKNQQPGLQRFPEGELQLQMPPTNGHQLGSGHKQQEQRQQMPNFPQQPLQQQFQESLNVQVSNQQGGLHHLLEKPTLHPVKDHQNQISTMAPIKFQTPMQEVSINDNQQQTRVTILVQGPRPLRIGKVYQRAKFTQSTPKPPPFSLFLPPTENQRLPAKNGHFEQPPFNTIDDNTIRSMINVVKRTIYYGDMDFKRPSQYFIFSIPDNIK